MNLLSRIARGAAIATLAVGLIGGLATSASATTAPDARKAEAPAAVAAAAADLAAALPSGTSTQASIRGFEHAYYGGARVMTNDIGYKCSGKNTVQVWWLTGTASWNLSSIRLNNAIGWGCNSIGVHASPIPGQVTGTWYYQCINRKSVGIQTFGFSAADGYYNDNIDEYSLRWDPNCPIY